MIPCAVWRAGEIAFFYWLLLGTTVLPYLVFPAVFAGKSPPNTEMVRQTILFLANAHIAITLFFYYDSRFRSVRAENPFRYTWLPVVAVITAGVSYALVPPSFEPLWWAVYVGWQNWHFGKQTFGLYALVSTDQSSRRVPQFERGILYAAVAFGTIGGLWLVTANTAWQGHAMTLKQWCGYGTLALMFAGAALIARAPVNLKHKAFFLVSIAFFAPQYLASSVDLGFTPYSVAHSLQYLFIMTVVAFNVRRPERTDGFDAGLITAVVFFAIVLFGGAIITIRGEFGDLANGLLGSPWLGRFVTGSMFGLVIAHFIVDAHAWRLRERPQRDFVMSRMPFLGRTASRLQPAG
jgi:hypothetical protein